MRSLPLCPRCKGKIIVDEDWTGPFLNCINCGYYHYFGETVNANRKYSPQEPVFARRRV